MVCNNAHSIQSLVCSLSNINIGSGGNIENQSRAIQALLISHKLTSDSQGDALKTNINNKVNNLLGSMSEIHKTAENLPEQKMAIRNFLGMNTIMVETLQNNLKLGFWFNEHSNQRESHNITSLKKPEKISDIDLAMQKINKAKELSKSGDTSQAKSLYAQSAEILMRCVKKNPNVQNK
eukprot:CAMPEP_0116989092 /NCGR_PEP_ID=MMETSP0467-20121206/64586_1 /TAXON_ID=283647 /ORGANISM="Mesodinium pulex, Strain SPMC105" /LENGTH=178 /DNA_ID=CAMNT_0004685417 /DNA_START=51 /DNA_END=584 /DNA_ORIENTATION=-